MILPAHIDTKPQTNFDDATHTEEVKSLIDKWLGGKKPETDTITLYAGCSPTSTLTFTPTDFGAQVGASIITKSLNNDFLFDHAVEMEQTDCGTFKTKVLPKKGEEFGFYLFWKDNLTRWESVSDIGCTSPNTDKCPPGDVLASLASCTNAVQNPGFVSHNRVFDGTTLTYNWGTCENSCGTKPPTRGGTPQLGKVLSHSRRTTFRTPRSVSRSQRRRHLLRPLRSPSSVPPSSPSSPSSPTKGGDHQRPRGVRGRSPTSNTARRAKQQQQQQQQRTRVLLLFFLSLLLSFYISFIYSTLPNTAAPKQKRRLGTRTHILYKVQRQRKKRSFVTHIPTHERCTTWTL